MRRNMLANNIYHVLSRGVDKRKIFLEDLDYLRFIHDMFEFNDTEPATNVNYFFHSQPQSIDIASPYIRGKRTLEKQKPRKLLIERRAGFELGSNSLF